MFFLLLFVFLLLDDLFLSLLFLGLVLVTGQVGLTLQRLLLGVVPLLVPLLGFCELQVLEGDALLLKEFVQGIPSVVVVILVLMPIAHTFQKLGADRLWTFDGLLD